MKVVILVKNGLVEVLTDDPTIKTLILDADTEGSDPGDLQSFLDKDEQFEALVDGQHEVQPVRVDSLFQQACI